MSIKDEVEFVKESLSNDEKMLESAFKVEKVYKKHKSKIWLTVSIIGLLIAYNVFSSYAQQKRLVAGNEALSTLEKSPDDKLALADLKQSSPKLYDLYRYSLAVKNSNEEVLKELSASDDELVSDLSKYHLGVLNGEPKDSKYYSDLSTLQIAYMAIKNKEYDAAREKLTEIDDKSSLAGIAKKMRHFLVGK